MHEDDDYEKLATSTERKKRARQNNLMYGGLIAIGVVILQGFLTASALGTTAKISVVAFAISLPLLAVLILLGELQSGDKAANPSMTDEAAKALALLSSVTGVVAAFWHIDWFAGVAVIGAGIIALGVYGTHFSSTSVSQAALRRRQQQATTQSATTQGATTQGPGRLVGGEQTPPPPSPWQPSTPPAQAQEMPTQQMPTITPPTTPLQPPAHPQQTPPRPPAEQ